MNKLLVCAIVAQMSFTNIFSQITISPTTGNVSCNGQCDGFIDIIVADGTPPYTYLWSNGDTIQNLSNLCGGNYEVTVTDALLDYTIQNIDVVEPLLLMATANVNNASCNGVADGQITLGVSGGTTPYAFNWNNGTNFQNQSNLPAGTYGFTIVDANACTTSGSETVQENNVAAQLSSVFPTCKSSNGTITVNVSSGTPPFTFKLGSAASQTSNVFTNLPENNYSILITDALGCSITEVVELTRIRLTIDKLTPANCSNQNGEIRMKAIGGTAPYTYVWNTGATGATLSNLPVGGYSVTVTGTAGCKSHTVVEVPFDTTCIGKVRGRAFYDHNNNCIFDANDAPMVASPIEIKDTSGIITGVVTDVFGYYQCVLPLGLYTIEPFANQLQNVACPVSGKRSANLTSAGMVINNLDFGIQSFPIEDVSIRGFWGVARPGFASNVWVTLTNNSTLPGGSNGTATLKLDSRVIPASANNSGVISGNTISWNYSLLPGATKTFNAIVQITPPPVVNINDVLVHIASITPSTTDDFSNNNRDTIFQSVQGSFDPNDKAVFPAGNLFAKDTVMKYTIRFQNTGNDTALVIIVRDTLDANLNPYTFRGFTASHPMTPVFVSNNVIEFRFDQIYLPDSFENEVASHGFVSFFINRYNNIPSGSIIKNSASIYFDYNTPVKTNTVENTFINAISSVEEFGNTAIKIYPNPASDRLFIEVEEEQFKNATLFDLNGARVADSTSPELSVSGLPQGLYVCKIELKTSAVYYTKIIVE